MAHDKYRYEDLTIEARRLLYHEYQETKRAAFQLQGDYGKWLIASLLLVHGAGVLFLVQNEKLPPAVVLSIFWWPIAGLMLALVCGFITWINWGLNAQLYGPIKASMIYNDEDWPKFDPGTSTWIGRTFRWSIAAGLLSALCILGAAVSTYCKMG